MHYVVYSLRSGSLNHVLLTIVSASWQNSYSLSHLSLLLPSPNSPKTTVYRPSSIFALKYPVIMVIGLCLCINLSFEKIGCYQNADPFLMILIILGIMFVFLHITEAVHRILHLFP